MPNDLTFAAARRTSRDSAPTSGRSESASYPPDEIIAAVKRWASLYGEPPTMLDWEPARARRLGHAWKAERFESDRWPTARIVRRRFASFNAAVEAAGFDPRPARSRRRPNLTGPEAIVDALIEWTRRYGDVPTMADWDPARARRLRQDWRIARFHQGDWPSARSVALHFGSFARAAEAAGLVPRPSGRHRGDRSAEQATNRRTAALASKTSSAPGVDDLADALRGLAKARARQDPVQTHAALLDVAGAALAWASVFGED